MVSRSVAGSSRSAFLEQAFYRVSVPASRRIPRSLFTSRFVKMKKAEPCASSGGESLFYTVAPALHSAEAGPLQEMDKDLPAGRVKIDRPVVPFRGKFIGCPYRSLLCPTKALTKSGGKFYKWNSSGSAKGVPSVRGNLPTLALSIGSGFTGFFMAKIYGNGEVCNGIFSPFRPRDIYMYMFRNYIRKEIYSSFFFFRLFTRFTFQGC